MISGCIHDLRIKQNKFVVFIAVIIFLTVLKAFIRLYLDLVIDFVLNVLRDFIILGK